MKNNLKEILESHARKKELEILYGEMFDFMIKVDWRGACHESCGVQYVLLNELGIVCDWRLGEVFYREREFDGRPVCFDHSWILIDGEIFDMALLKTNYPEFDSYPTIRNRNLKTLKEPEVIYDTNSGWGDDLHTKMIKGTPLSVYFDNSPLHPSLGTWALVQHIGRKVGITTNITALRKKYNGIYWT